jgi:hypothetical protein
MTGVRGKPLGAGTTRANRSRPAGCPTHGGDGGPGNQADLISSAGKLVAADVAVLAVEPGPPGSGALSMRREPRLPTNVIAAVGNDAAKRLATVGPSGLCDSTFSLVMRTPWP